ncbi:MAG: hypothetical protein M3342_19690 [Bacteroidota bacterium]|nr:hypothetical protein [Flavisolibacter sp.]MBD0368207.1 hypothetical protein [Flavisolibacter sp.]MBD0376769.1 hypothetical protein [Flavisolibacter sp.]MDQ3846207.1 hypothetical protein [Bacteroidota bacterium]
MKEREENSLPQDKDRHLDAPAEASQDKHINFLEVEEDDNKNAGDNRKDKETEERQKQWKQGLQEGREARNSE